MCQQFLVVILADVMMNFTCGYPQENWRHTSTKNVIRWLTFEILLRFTQFFISFLLKLEYVLYLYLSPDSLNAKEITSCTANLLLTTGPPLAVWFLLISIFPLQPKLLVEGFSVSDIIIGPNLRLALSHVLQYPVCFSLWSTQTLSYAFQTSSRLLLLGNKGDVTGKMSLSLIWLIKYYGQAFTKCCIQYYRLLDIIFWQLHVHG